MQMINGLGLSGPYKNEQKFKMDFIDKMRTRAYADSTFFCIETEETEPGFPDVICLNYRGSAKFYEIKFADSKDNFEMRRSQPLFYRQHKNLDITVVVWSSKRNKAYSISKNEIVDKVLKSNSLNLNLDSFKE